MDWHQSAKPFIPLPQPSLSLFHNYNNNTYPEKWTVPEMDNGNKDKKKRLTRNQVELLEMNFQEKMKLDPERKMQLSMELSLQPRQIAVWFQNRRARWKNKQLEHSYNVLKHQYDEISKENEKLQEEVIKLNAMLSKEQPFKTHPFGGYTEMRGEEIVESMSKTLRGSNKTRKKSNIENVVDQSLCSFIVEDNNTVSLPHCHGLLPHISYYEQI
ncbi:hypothetical protein VNO78_26776 [Psophocarpus tetragonolobus]|uniref:Homeobox-leucine zipper protein n=1 Tax=Psophocarpus tetragonolobus TaxID=3891 RepID=A0AAN9S0N4_PSOTE